MKYLLAALVISILACAKLPTKNASKEQQLVDEAIKAHGGALYDNAHYSFLFRGKQYAFKHENGRYTYTFDHTKNDRAVHYYLDNDQFVYTVNGDTMNLSDKDQVRYGNQLNSVIYFALLPYRLNDPAVRKAYKGISKIKGQSYQTVEVRFTEEKGGTDHEDVYYYWINEQSKTVDYLAYNFHVNGGGVRFRSAFNPRTIGGIRFQDYENYSAEFNTPLADLPALYEKGALKLLSKVELTSIQRIADQ